MAYLVEVPVESGGVLRVEAGAEDLPQGLQLAARPGEVAAKARDTLEQALDQLQPMVGAVAQRLRAMSPQSFEVEFGIKLTAEAGAVVAKGTGAVHFKVTMSWGDDAGRARPGDDD